jgi:hypothetical protein
MSVRIKSACPKRTPSELMRTNTSAHLLLIHIRPQLHNLEGKVPKVIEPVDGFLDPIPFRFRKLALALLESLEEALTFSRDRHHPRGSRYHGWNSGFRLIAASATSNVASRGRNAI